MTNFIPIFPLEIVVYPGEFLNLHIFEEKYKQLITDCYAEAKPFGIPTVLNKEVAEMGTLVDIIEITEVMEDGKMNIRTKGNTIFKVLELVKDIPDKRYSGAIVNYPANFEQSQPTISAQILNSIDTLYQILNIQKDFKKTPSELLSYDVAHHVGLNISEEYELLGLMYESQRLEYLRRHLDKILPIVTNAEKLKEKVRLNGHFKEIKGFDLK